MGGYSTAMGSCAYASTNGSFVFGDASTGPRDGNCDEIRPTADNQFAVRAAGGVRFRTASNLSTGCDLGAGSGSWSCTSSKQLKNAFESVDGENLLSSVRGLPVMRWSYTTERARSSIRCTFRSGSSRT